MEHTVYNYSLCMALALMLFFAFDFLIGKAPAKTIYNNYLRSRRIMGVAILVLSLNYAVHFVYWNPLHQSQCSHTDEPVHLFLLLLVIQHFSYGIT